MMGVPAVVKPEGPKSCNRRYSRNICDHPPRTLEIFFVRTQTGVNQHKSVLNAALPNSKNEKFSIIDLRRLLQLNLSPGENPSNPINNVQGRSKLGGFVDTARIYNSLKQGLSSTIRANNAFGSHRCQSNVPPPTNGMCIQVLTMLNLAWAAASSSHFVVLIGRSSSCRTIFNIFSNPLLLTLPTCNNRSIRPGWWSSAALSRCRFPSLCAIAKRPPRA